MSNSFHRYDVKEILKYAYQKTTTRWEMNNKTVEEMWGIHQSELALTDYGMTRWDCAWGDRCSVVAGDGMCRDGPQQRV